MATLSPARSVAYAVALSLALVLAGTPAVRASETTLNGTVVAKHSDDFTTSHSRATLLLQERDGDMVRLKGETNGLKPGAAAKLDGKLRSGTLDVRRTRRVSAARRRQARISSSSAKRVAVILLNFSNDSSEPWTPTEINDTVFAAPDSVSNYFAEESSGDMSVSGDVFGWYSISSNNNNCNNFNVWANQALTEAANAGDNLSGYDNYVFMWPHASSCGWAGLAYLPGSWSYINGAATLRVISHELGHNFGVHHGSSYRCTSDGQRVFMSSSCTRSEYGDPFTVMGSASTYHSHAWHKMQLGYLPQSALQTVSASGDYQLAPSEQQIAGKMQLLRVPRTSYYGYTSDYYYLDYRQPFGSYFDTFSPYSSIVSGVSVRIAAGLSSRSQSKLLDANPQTSSFTDAPLQVGESAYDPETGTSFSTVAASSQGATVRIELGATPPQSGPANPTEPTNDPTPGDDDPTGPAKPKKQRPKLAASLQRANVARKGRLVINAVCEPTCSLSATGTVKIRKRKFKLVGVGKSSRAGSTTRLVLRLPKKARRLARRSLRRKRRVVAHVRVVASNSLGTRVAKRRLVIES